MPPVPVKGETWKWNNNEGAWGKVTIRLSEDDVVVYNYLSHKDPYAFSVEDFLENFTKVEDNG